MFMFSDEFAFIYCSLALIILFSAELTRIIEVCKILHRYRYFVLFDIFIFNSNYSLFFYKSEIRVILWDSWIIIGEHKFVIYFKVVV